MLSSKKLFDFVAIHCVDIDSTDPISQYYTVIIIKPISTVDSIIDPYYTFLLNHSEIIVLFINLLQNHLVLRLAYNVVLLLTGYIEH